MKFHRRLSLPLALAAGMVWGETDAVEPSHSSALSDRGETPAPMPSSIGGPSLPVPPSPPSSHPSSSASPRVVRIGGAAHALPQEPLPAVQADRALLLIGGFGDEIHGIMHHLTGRLRQIQAAPVAYYHWHAGRPDVPREGIQSIARDIATFRHLNPQADIVLIGHSLGAGTALRLAAMLPPGQGRVYLLTLDPIDSTCTPVRPRTVTWWGNAYITHSQSGYDFLLAAGGRWNACRAADINLRFDGRCRDEQGMPYIHDRAEAMLFSRTLGPSLYERWQSTATP